MTRRREEQLEELERQIEELESEVDMIQDTLANVAEELEALDELDTGTTQDAAERRRLRMLRAQAREDLAAAEDELADLRDRLEALESTPEPTFEVRFTARVHADRRAEVLQWLREYLPSEVTLELDDEGYVDRVDACGTLLPDEDANVVEIRLSAEGLRLRDVREVA
jgi:chromosome segregation ATPase